MTTLEDADAWARAQALDPERSFIVQAPAGSGKTSLLTQRFLRLLATVERPEEVVAITFTRKAAAEMRHRIVAALREAAAAAAEPANEVGRLTRELAAAALANSRRRGWQLERHPARLHVQTIDGFNHWLARRMPIAARIGLSPTLLDDASPLYARAARQLVARLDDAEPLADALLRLARLLDHAPARLEATLAGMLGRRELWLPKLLELAAGPGARPAMESLLIAAVERELQGLRAALVGGPAEAAAAAIAAAARAGGSTLLEPLRDATGLPPAAATALPAWRCLADVLLTRDGDARARLDKRDGFPAELRQLKQPVLAAAAALGADPVAAAALAAVRDLPPAGYTDAQWELVEALRAVLSPAAAELQAAFAEAGQLDHAAVAAAAREALGAEDAPTELALALEYRIRHLLVDEYQDTSPAQVALLRRLVAGWTPGDGHTLFCVGDPMQSIYAFREADVTLFLEAQVHGIGGVPLEPLVLTRNFRSCASLVDWANAAFAAVLPAEEDYERGAVRHAPSAATREDEPDAGVTIHAGDGGEEGGERVAGIVAAALGEIAALDARGDAGGAPRTVAVLVRSRSALPPILAALRRRGIGYRGVELESLGDRAAVRDVLALARALLHRGDRPAWLAVLRAPWCGLTLAELHALAAGDPEAPLPALLVDPPSALPPDGRMRALRVQAVLEQAERDLGREPLGCTVRAAWLALGGPATLEDPGDLDNVAACLAALDTLETEVGGRPEASAVERAIERLMASPTGSADARVVLMTIHKAKGLEFDTVVVPALERTVPASERQLLYWAPVAVAPGARGIVFASRGEDGPGRVDGALERWMRRLERDRARLELGRLAYVAATRARRRLHLVGDLPVVAGDDGGRRLGEPPDDALLGVLWPVLAPAFEAQLPSRPGAPALRDDAARPRAVSPPLRRLPAGFVLPPAAGWLPPAEVRAGRLAAGPVRPDFDWAGEEARVAGVLVHRELERIGRARLPVSALADEPARWHAALLGEGLPESRAAAAAQRVRAALARVRSSDVAARLLDPLAAEAVSELALTADLDGELVRVRIDRSFVDPAGHRWIVDWKTGHHSGGGLEHFLAEELERYAPQLARYARVLRLYDGRPQRLALYFPLLDRLAEWRDPGGL